VTFLRFAIFTPAPFYHDRARPAKHDFDMPRLSTARQQGPGRGDRTLCNFAAPRSYDEGHLHPALGTRRGRPSLQEVTSDMFVKMTSVYESVSGHLKTRWTSASWACSPSSTSSPPTAVRPPTTR